MKTQLFRLALAGLLTMAASQIAANDQCVMCHQDQKENAVAAHSDCMACHAGGAEEHIASFRTPPEPVSEETCTGCHQPTEEFKAISAHTMGMECSSCHAIHED